MLDLVLAILHHPLIFALFSALIDELVLVNPEMDPVVAAHTASIDMWYGVLAGLILVVGFSRSVFAATGWPYYEHNALFLAKIAAFLVIAQICVRPTVVFIRWQRAPADPAPGQIAVARRHLWVELVLSRCCWSPPWRWRAAAASSEQAGAVCTRRGVSGSPVAAIEPLATPRRPGHLAVRGRVLRWPRCVCRVPAATRTPANLRR